MGSLAMKIILALLLLLNLGAASAETSMNAKELQAKYTSLSDKLRNNHYGRPLYMESQEHKESLKGDIYAVVDHPFATFSTALDNPDHWCDVLLLHLNIKYCQATPGKSGTLLSVNLGKKAEQPLSKTYRLDFAFRSNKPSPDYFQIELTADSGPVGTRDYRILLEAVPLKNNKTFMHLTYTYAFGLSSRLATNTYLSTVGRDKVGFTITGKNSDGKPQYVNGVRGVIERNTMRYYLAIDAYLGGLSAPAPQQFEKRLKLVIDATEEYPLQLHEVDRRTYLEMKRHEHQRQQQSQASL
jgi:hypothetical protein